MSDVSQGPDWWQASDGKWYPPQPEQTAAAAAPAGWFSDPLDPAGQRYWDGTAWTEHTAPGAGAAIAPAAATAVDDPAGEVTLPADALDEFRPRIGAAEPAPMEPAAADPFGGFGSPAAAPPVAASSASAPPPPAPPAAEASPPPPGFGSVASGPPGIAEPVPGWHWPLVVAGLSVLSIFLPVVSVQGEAVHPFRDGNDELLWSSIWPVLIANGLLVVAGLSAKAGRPGWLSVAAGVSTVAAAINIAVVAIYLEWVVGFNDLGIDITPHVGFFTNLGVVGACVALLMSSVRGALSRTRDTVPGGLNLALSACAGWVLFVLAREYFANDAPIWDGDFFWLNLVTIVLFGPLLLMTVLPLIARNADAAAIAAGYAFPLGTLFLFALLADDNNGEVGVTDGGGAGIAFIAMFVVGSIAAAAFGRRLVRQGGVVTDVHAPQPSLVWAAIGVGLLALVLAGTADDGSNQFGMDLPAAVVVVAP
ncbi:MAG: DUF2510 domain-containing protein [Actinomycetota bacterium]